MAGQAERPAPARRSTGSSRSTTTRGTSTVHDFGAGQVAGEPIFVPRSRGQRRGRRLAAVRSSTRRPSTARGWWCSTRATSSPTRSRSRTCATTSRSASTGRSRAASPHDRRGPPAQPVHPVPCRRPAAERVDVAAVHDPSPRGLRRAHDDGSQDGQGPPQMRPRDPQGRQGVPRVDPAHCLAEERRGRTPRAACASGAGRSRASSANLRDGTERQRRWTAYCETVNPNDYVGVCHLAQRAPHAREDHASCTAPGSSTGTPLVVDLRGIETRLPCRPHGG